MAREVEAASREKEEAATIREPVKLSHRQTGTGGNNKLDRLFPFVTNKQTNKQGTNEALYEKGNTKSCQKLAGLAEQAEMLFAHWSLRFLLRGLARGTLLRSLVLARHSCAAAAMR